MEQIQVMGHCLHHLGELGAPQWAMRAQGILLLSYVQEQVGEQQVGVAMELVPAQEGEIVEEVVVLTTSQIPVHLHLATLESFVQDCTLLLPRDLLSHLLGQDPTNTCLLFSLLPSYLPHKVFQTLEELDHNHTILLPLRKQSLIPAYLV